MQKVIALFLCVIFILLFPLNIRPTTKDESPKTAFLLIDIQDFYFLGGRVPLVNPEEASLNAKKLLDFFRENNWPVVHVRHNAKSGAEIHKNVKPIETEKIVSKDDVNAFRNTDLLAHLNENKVKRLVICGMMTHMCVEAATRAAHDYGFECILVHDACATRALKFNDVEIPTDAVHNSTLASLSGYYARVMDTETFLKNLSIDRN